MSIPLDLKINGKNCKITFSRVCRGWLYFYKWGKDINGRACKVSEHSLPSHVFASKRFKIKTGGNTYERGSK